MTARYEPVQFRTQPGLGLHVAASGWSRRFLLSPSRNPDEPRFWCMRVDICTTTGDPDPDLPSLIVGWSLSHAEMVERFRQIRAEAAEWIAAEEQAGLRTWLIEHDIRAPRPSNPEQKSPTRAPTMKEEANAQA